MPYVECEPESYAEPPSPKNILDNLQHECETIAVDENKDPDASNSEEGAVEGDDTREAQEEEIIKISIEFLCIIAQQKAYILHNKLPKSLLKELLNIENAIVTSNAKSCNTQTKLLSFSVINFGQLWSI